MSKDEQRILELGYQLSMCLGALEVVKLTKDFNRDGLADLIKRTRDGLDGNYMPRKGARDAQT